MIVDGQAWVARERQNPVRASRVPDRLFAIVAATTTIPISTRSLTRAIDEGVRLADEDDVDIMRGGIQPADWWRTCQWAGTA
jgi:hypothetical protein